jgi:Zn-dependent protease
MDQSLSMMIAVLAGLLFSLVVHEYAHALVADWLGDDTPRVLGRLTLNPLPHLDPFLSVVLPIITALTTGIPFGGAKPVPVNPLNFRINRYTGMLLVAVAGPIANFLLAFVFALTLNLLPPLEPRAPEFALNLYIWLIRLVQVNITLGLFNLVPIPPLDGSKIIAAFLPRDTADWLMSYHVSLFGMLLIGVLVTMGFANVLGPIVFAVSKAVIELVDFWG